MEVVMQFKYRILIAISILVVIVGVVIGVETQTRNRLEASSDGDEPAGSIPILVGDEPIAYFVPGDLETLRLVSFVDDEENKTQEGWLLRDVLLIYLEESLLMPYTEIRVSSSSRGKSTVLKWDEIDRIDNMVMFDLSGRGTLKLVSKMEGMDLRDDWVQDVDQIEVMGQ
jgi:hypothetical protein